MSDCSETWVAVVYEDCDKIDSHNFHGDHEAANTEATKWINKFHYGREWVLHHVVNHVVNHDVNTK